MKFGILKGLGVALLALALVFGFRGTGLAQANVWVQIEAQPTLAQAQTRARAYANAFPNVAGFRMASGWYAISLGPYSRRVADQELATLRGNRLIPSDSFIAFSSAYRQQFWPVGGAASPQPTQPVQPVVTQPPEPVIPSEETVAEARASERGLDRPGRELLQEALKWEGFYTSAIDGAFGPGTRNAMAAWQEAQNFEPTGILTTKQRAKLIADYHAPFEALGLAQIRDEEAGIEMIIPSRHVKFETLESPFVQYNSASDRGMRMLLISQAGDQSTLWGLYDIMQTLEIVPTEGFRERNRRTFVLTGQDSEKHSYTFAMLQSGTVKGFTILYKPEDEKLMTEVVKNMRESFTPITGIVLPDTAGSDAANQRIDLVAGLELRRPDRSRSGFYVDGSGSVLTTTDVLGQCSRVTIGEDVEASVTARDADSGLALVQPKQTLAPIAHARFASVFPRLQSEVAVAGYSYEDVLTSPVLTYGKLADIRGLRGDDALHRLEMRTLPGDAGGPLYDRSGAVLGMLLPRTNDNGRQLPEDVSFAAQNPSILGFLLGNGVDVTASETSPALAPEDLTELAADMTVLVSCWN